MNDTKNSFYDWKRCGLDPDTLLADFHLLDDKDQLGSYIPISQVLRISEDEADQKIRTLPAKFQNISLEKAKLLQKEYEDIWATTRVFLAGVKEKEALELSRKLETDSDLLDVLSYCKNPLIRKQIAENPNTPLQALVRLAREFFSYVHKNPSWGLAWLEKPDWIRSLSLRDLEFLKDPLVSTALLKEVLQFHTEGEIIQLVAEHPNCPVSAFSRLASHQHWTIRNSLARNKKCPTHLLETLTTDRVAMVRASLALNTNCSDKIFSQLVLDSYFLTRENLAKNTSCPIDILQKLLLDRNERVRNIVRLHPKLSQ